jgi:alpha-galactosidase
VCDTNEKRFPQVNIGGIVATDGYQAWGDPKQNVSVDGRDVVIHGVPFKDAIGVHARSVLKFPINGRFSRLTGSVGLPDYLLEAHAGAGSVVFEVLLDGNSVWHSDRITSGQAAVSFTVPLHGAKALELRVEDGGDGIDSDHAIWAGLTFDKLADTENGLFTPKT